MSDGPLLAAFLTIIPFAVAGFAFKKVAGPTEGRTRRRRYTAWGLALCLAWGGMSLMKDYASLFYALDRISANMALGLFFSLTLVIAIMSAIGAGIGYLLALATDKVKGHSD